MTITAPHCVQCGNEMPYGVIFTAYDAYEKEKALIRLQTCNNPECPNYGLLQLGKESMDSLLCKE